LKLSFETTTRGITFGGSIIMEILYLNKKDSSEVNVLILDDEKPVQRTLGRLLKFNGYPYSIASDTAEARSIMKMQDISLILCDVNMPGESGLDFIKYVSKAYPDTAIIMVTGNDDSDLAETALDMGAYGYIIKPFRPNELMINISNALKRRSLEINNRLNIVNMEKIIDSRTSELMKAMEKLRKTTDGIIHAISLTVETRDPYTAGHQQRVADLSRAISIEMGLSQDQTESIRLAGLIHDLGKIAVPAEILSKPSKLSDIEFSLMKIHPQAAYDILKDIDFPWPLSLMVFQHHERLDGSGYPQGLKGKDNIMLEARILAVADVFEAMASHRPYRPALGKEKALNELLRGKGTCYDSEAVDACMKVISSGEFNAVFT
jgi:putative two-component system response regulator